MFTLDSRLANDAVEIGEFPLSLVLLSRDANYPWYILVPKRSGIREIHELSAEDRLQLLNESCALAEIIQHQYQPDKLNIAALGNMVPQLHIHHIARYQHDSAWPQPIWGKVAMKAYAEEELSKRVVTMQGALSECGVDFSP